MAESRATAALAADRPVSRTAALVIAFVWAASIALEHSPLTLNRGSNWGIPKVVLIGESLAIDSGDDDAEGLFAGFA